MFLWPTRHYDALVCPHCLTPVEQLDHFCPRCAGPITSHASIDPIGQIYATGRAYRKAIENPRPIVVIGMWLLFAPPLLLMVLTLAEMLRSLRDGQNLLRLVRRLDSGFGEGVFSGIVTLLFLGGYGWICVTILCRVTRSYWRQRDKAANPPGFEPLVGPPSERDADA